MTLIPLSHILIFSLLLFVIGFYGALVRRNVIGILISIELMLNAANINLIAFNKFLGSSDGLGQVFALFVIAIAAAASVVGLVLIIAVYRKLNVVFLEKFNLLKW